MPADVPLPVMRGEERVYFEAAARGQLGYQRCRSCAEVIFYPRVVCPACLSADLDLRESAGRGHVYSFSTLYRAGHPSLADRVPYTVVLVDMDEGFRVLADLVGCGPAEVTVGMAVQVVFDQVADGFTIPRFRQATARRSEAYAVPAASTA